MATNNSKVNFGYGCHCLSGKIVDTQKNEYGTTVILEQAKKNGEPARFQINFSAKRDLDIPTVGNYADITVNMASKVSETEKGTFYNLYLYAVSVASNDFGGKVSPATSSNKASTSVDDDEDNELPF